MTSLTACSVKIENRTMEDTKRRHIHFPTIRTSTSVKVWAVVDGNKQRGGKPIKFTIQEIPEDRHEDVVDHMCTYFLADEPICSSINSKDDPLIVEDFRAMWMSMLKQGISVAAFTEDPDGGKPIIAGTNLLGVDIKDHDTGLEKFEYLSPKSKRVFETVISISSEAHVYERYNVEKYMFAFGLSVHPGYRGQALGGHILKARLQIGREYNIPATLTAFTSPASQKLAERAGFDLLIEREFNQIVDEKGNLVFPNIKSKTLKIMARTLP